MKKLPNKLAERRETTGYTDFIKTAMTRDNYSCVICGSKEELVVHHLDGFNWCVEKRVDPTNGVTLCGICHRNFHSKYGSGNNTKE